nr:MAG TPA: hypothetical protein [Caudoviricetes sp.]
MQCNGMNTTLLPFQLGSRVAYSICFVLTYLMYDKISYL